MGKCVLHQWTKIVGRGSCPLTTETQAVELYLAWSQAWMETTSQGLSIALDPWEILLLAQSLPCSVPSSISISSLGPASSFIPVSWDLKGEDLGACFRRQTYNSGHVRCHLEGRSAFPKWKQCALKVIMGRKACSGAKPSILKQRLPFLPGGQPRKDQVNPISPRL